MAARLFKGRSQSEFSGHDAHHMFDDENVLLLEKVK